MSLAQDLPYEIRSATPADAAALAEFCDSSFRETFAPFNKASDMDLYVNAAFNPEKILSEIRDPNRRIRLAIANGKVVGCAQLLVGKPETCVSGPRPVELLRLYVDSKWHGKKLGHTLMEQSIAQAKQENFLTLWLGVWEENHRACAFYKKWGFQEVGEHTFVLGTDPQRDLILSKNVEGN